MAGCSSNGHDDDHHWIEFWAGDGGGDGDEKVGDSGGDGPSSKTDVNDTTYTGSSTTDNGKIHNQIQTSKSSRGRSPDTESAGGTGLGDGWHTHEGVSRGNDVSMGPWDKLSLPMRRCLMGVQKKPKDGMQTMVRPCMHTCVSIRYIPHRYMRLDVCSNAWSQIGWEREVEIKTL